MAATTIPGLAIKVDVDTKEFEKELKEMNKKLQQSLESVDKMGDNIKLGTIFNGITAGITAARAAIDTVRASIQGVVAAYSAKADEIGKLTDFSDQVDISTEALTALGRGARQDGTDFDVLRKGLLKFRSTLGDAMNGSKSAQKVFEDLGLSVNDLASMSTEEALGRVSDKLNSFWNPSARAAAGESIFGKPFKDLELFLRRGSDGFSQLNAEAKRLGIPFSREDLEGVNAADDAIKDVIEQFGALGTAIAIEAAPHVMLFTEELKGVLKDLPAMVDDFSSVFNEVGFAIKETVNLFTGAIQAAGSVIKSLADYLDQTFGSKMTPAQKEAKRENEIKQLMIHKNRHAADWEKNPFMQRRLDELQGNKPSESAKPVTYSDKVKSIRDELSADGMRKKTQRELMRARNILGQGFGDVGNALSNWWGGGEKEKAGGGVAAKSMAPSFAGALEQGTAAAYAAAYQKDSRGKTEEKIEKNTEKTNTLLKAGFDGLKAVIPKFKFATA